MASEKAQVRAYSVGEEIANSVSHGLGFVVTVAATPWLILTALDRGTTAVVVGVSVFAATLMLMFMTSTLYHALPHPRAKSVLRLLDHNAIFLLIAGTYTPILLGVLNGPWGWTLFGLVWGLALAGIVLKSVSGHRFHGLVVGIYVLMGWIIVIAFKPLVEAMALPGILWLVAGGVFYTGGLLFYGAKRLPYAHFIWHLFVIAGAFCHFIAIMGYAF
ncbi:MAG: hemolysin III family protein [Xanthomonadales bacterium]